MQINHIRRNLTYILVVGTEVLWFHPKK